MVYYIKYTVDGFPGEQKAGPYSDRSDADYHLTDIRSYEGVKDAYVSFEEQ